MSHFVTDIRPIHQLRDRKSARIATSARAGDSRAYPNGLGELRVPALDMLRDRPRRDDRLTAATTE